MTDDRMPISRAILWILVATLFMSGSAFMGWLYYLHVRERKFHDDQYRIVALIQNTPQTDTLKTVYLAELLDLSWDRPINLYQFNLKEAVQTLLRHPVIKEALVQKILPGTLYIQYQMRTPLAYVGDFANTVIDEEGYLFPFHPFYTPKYLPTFYLGLEKEECKWGSCLSHLFSVQLAFELLMQFANLQQESFNLRQLDVMQAQADSYGQRQIVMVLERKATQFEVKIPKSLLFLRLSPDYTEQGLRNFQTLQAARFDREQEGQAKEASRIIDLRIPQLAFIKTCR